MPRQIMFLNKQGVCLICRCLGAELPHPEILARLRREKAARHNGTINRLAFRDLAYGLSRVTGWHQLPPMTPRAALAFAKERCGSRSRPRLLCFVAHCADDPELQRRRRRRRRRLVPLLSLRVSLAHAAVRCRQAGVLNAAVPWGAAFGDLAPRSSES